MSTWAIGDVQGCRASLERLLEVIAFDERVDHLWFVGDLVNRGPDSLGTLRLVQGLGAAATVVLGNHDIYLVARALGVVRRAGAEGAERGTDDLDVVLEAPDAGVLLRWLRSQPLAVSHASEPWLMVHAGLHPSWSVRQALEEASAVQATLSGPDEGAAALLARAFGGAPVAWSAELEGLEREAAALALLTRARCLGADGALALGFHGPMDQRPAGLEPWWRCSHARPGELTVVVGHWAALGLHREPGLLALDTGCVWGRELTAVRLEDGFTLSVPGPRG